MDCFLLITPFILYEFVLKIRGTLVSRNHMFSNYKYTLIIDMHFVCDVYILGITSQHLNESKMCLNQAGNKSHGKDWSLSVYWEPN